MNTHIQRMVRVYTDHPVRVLYKVELRSKRISRMIEHLRELEATREVEGALNRYFYGS
jgi:hypothetical protein